VRTNALILQGVTEPRAPLWVTNDDYHVIWMDAKVGRVYHNPKSFEARQFNTPWYCSIIQIIQYSKVRLATAHYRFRGTCKHADARSCLSTHATFAVSRQCDLKGVLREACDLNREPTRKRTQRRVAVIADDVVPSGRSVSGGMAAAPTTRARPWTFGLRFFN
jgi:hypothetical protein